MTDMVDEAPIIRKGNDTIPVQQYIIVLLVQYSVLLDLVDLFMLLLEIRVGS